MTTPSNIQKWRANNREHLRAYDREFAHRPGQREKRAAQARALHAKRAELVSTIKLERGCARCGYNKCAGAMDFHHREGEDKLGNVGSMKDGLKRLLAEIEKCDVLCANCHREEHTP